MSTAFDFARSPEQRRRARERLFYQQLACAALLGMLPVLLLSCRTDEHTRRIGEASQLLSAELQTLQPQPQQAAATQQRIRIMLAQLEQHEIHARQLRQPARVLRIVSAASGPETRLDRLIIQSGRVELYGNADATETVQAQVTTLQQAGLDGIAIRGLHTIAKQGGLRYDFSLSAPLPPPAQDTSRTTAR